MVSLQYEVCLELIKASDKQVTLGPSHLLAAETRLCHSSESWEVAVSLLRDWGQGKCGELQPKDQKGLDHDPVVQSLSFWEIPSYGGKMLDFLSIWDFKDHWLNQSCN